MAIKSHEIRDPVHGLVKLSKKEMEIELDGFGLSFLQFLSERKEIENERNRQNEGISAQVWRILDA